MKNEGVIVLGEGADFAPLVDDEMLHFLSKHLSFDYNLAKAINNRYLFDMAKVTSPNGVTEVVMGLKG